MSSIVQQDMHSPFQPQKHKYLFMIWTDLVRVYREKKAFSYFMAEDAYHVPLGSSTYWEDLVISAH